MKHLQQHFIEKNKKTDTIYIRKYFNFFLMKKLTILTAIFFTSMLTLGCTIDLDLGYDTDTKEEAKPEENVTTANISDYAKEEIAEEEVETEEISTEEKIEEPSKETPVEPKAEEPQVDTPWKLTSGTPPYADPTPIVYEGKVTLTGWIENVPSYVPGTEQDHFTLSDESLAKMPSDLLHKENRYYQLNGVTDEQMVELKTATKENPATIIVDKLTIVQEGTPSLRLVSIVKVK